MSPQSMIAWLHSRKHYVAVLLMAALVLLLSYRIGYPRVSCSDETYYAVAARNLAEHGSLNTTLYLPKAIVQTGYPHRDTHWPGYMIFLAIPVAIFGATDAAMVLLSQISYLLSCLLVFWAGRRVFSTAVGYASAAAFCVYPLFFFYANTAMAESLLVFIGLLLFVTWVAALERPRMYQSVVLSLLLIVGVLVRQTFLVFLPPTLYALWRWPSATRRRASALFSLSFLVLLLGVVYPLSLNRAQWANTFYKILERGDLWLIVCGFADNFVLQASRYLSLPEEFPDDYIRLMQVVIALLVIVAFTRSRGLQKIAAGYFLFTFAGMWFVLAVLYTPSGTRGMRNLMVTLPPGLIALNGLFLGVRRRWIGYTLAGVQLACFFAFAWVGMVGPSLDRMDFHEEESREARVIAENINAYQPQVVMAYKPWLYALEYFPIDVVWRLPESLEMMQQMQQHLVIDAIVLDDAAERDRFVQAAREGLITGGFRSVNLEPVDGYYFLVRGDLFSRPVGATLGRDLTLLGIDVADAVRAGDPLSLTLVWEANSDISTDYVLAVRLINGQGREVQYWLGRPVLSSHPTTEWQSGEVVPDTWDITIDPSLSAGTYWVEVEVYDALTTQSVGKTFIGDVQVESAGE